MAGKYGAIAVCKRPGSKYFTTQDFVLKQTTFLPLETTFTDRIYYILNHLSEPKKCSCGCGNLLINPRTNFLRGHSNKDTSVKQKKIESALRRYGVQNPSQAEEIKQKKTETYKKHYGTEHYMQSKFGQDTVKAIFKKKYGVENPFQYEPIKKNIQRQWQKNKTAICAKRVQTSRRAFYKNLIQGSRLKNKFTPLFSEEEFCGVGKIRYRFQCTQCQSICESNLDDGLLPRCLACQPYIDSGGQSVIEHELVRYVKTLEPNIKVQNRKEIFPMELDIYLPTHRIGIELDGLYWHSELNGKSKNYHLNKTKACQAKNIRLIHIFEDEWREKQRIVQNRIRNLLHKNKYKIHGRQCEIHPIDVQLCNRFLNKYHIQGGGKANIHLGAFRKNRLVAVMTFSSLRPALGGTPKTGYWELSRFCTLPNFSVVGIANKLLSHFEKTKQPKQLITYADLRWNTGNLYTLLGFVLSHQSLPNYWYVSKADYQKRIHRYNFQKHLLREKLESYDSTMNEWENMKNNGYDRIWDCGNLVFKKTY